MNYRLICPADNAPLAALIRSSLKSHALALPGTVYFDANLDRLSDFYLAEPRSRAYFVLLDANGQVGGGIGLAECSLFPACAELQKLYLAEEMKGSGTGYFLIRLAEETARGFGYRRLYLETHTNLAAAVHIYEKSGYSAIPKPAAVIHSTMNRFFVKELSQTANRKTAPAPV